MRRPSLLLALPVLLSGCAVAPDPTADTGGQERPGEEEAATFELTDDLVPSAISPDEELLCTEGSQRYGDCTDEGALRWSLPLEGEYRVQLLPDPVLHHTDTGAHSVTTESLPGRFVATEADGGDTLVYAENARIRGLDADTGELRWRVELDEELDEEESGFLPTGVNSLRPLGDELLVLFDDGLVVLDARDGAVGTVVGPAPSLGTLEHVQGDYALTVHEDRDEGPHVTTIDLSEGQVLWEGPLPDGETRLAGVYDHHIYIVWMNSAEPSLVDRSRSEGWLARIDIRDGELEHLVDEYSDPARTYSGFAGLHPDGYVVLDSREEGTYAYDYEQEELLWEHGDSLTNLTPLDTPHGAAFRSGDNELLDAVTGEALPEDTQTEQPGSGTNTSTTSGRIPTDDSMDGLVSRLRRVSGAPEGVGTFGLSQGGTRAVALACAPDGVQDPDPEDRAAGAVCEHPRLYAVNSSD